MLQEIDVLHSEMARVADRSPLWHDEKVARSHGLVVFEGHYSVVFVNDVRGLLLANDASEHVLPARR